MNDKYTSLNMIYIENTIRKFHQMGCREVAEDLFSQNNIFYETPEEIDDYIPDYYLSSYTIDMLPSIYNGLFSAINIIRTERKYPIYLSMITNNVHGVENGAYYYSFVTGKIYQIKKNDKGEGVVFGDANMTICFYVDIKKSVFIDQIEAYKYSLIEMGMLAGEILRRTKEIFSVREHKKINFNSITHSQNLNLNNLLCCYCISLKEF